MLREPEIFHVLDFLFSASFFGSYSFYTLLTLSLPCWVVTCQFPCHQVVSRLGRDRLRRLLTTCMMYLTYLQALQDV